MTNHPNRSRPAAAAWRYVLAIRNTDKREYGIRYLEHLFRNAPEPEPDGISTMAAQAVRMRLHDIWNPR